MALTVTCNCGAAYSVADDKAGRKLQCRHCSAIVDVPLADFDAEFDELISRDRPAKKKAPRSKQRVAREATVKETAARKKTASAPPRQREPAGLLPPVAKKKKKTTRVDSEVDGTPRARRQKSDASEVIAPLVVAGISLGLVMITSLALKPEDSPIAFWLVLRTVMISFSLVVTFGALFVASMFVEADYGYISSGILKVTAIVLTQAWIDNLYYSFPVPFVFSIIAWLVTYAMFKFFFGLDDAEAIASMSVVRLVHWVVIVFFFAYLFSGRGIDLPNEWQGDDDARIEVEEMEFDADGTIVPRSMPDGAAVPPGDDAPDTDE